MTKEPLLTTHNAERGARSTCREEPETGPSLEASEHHHDCLGDLENHLESKHGENSSEKHYGDIRRLENI